MKATSRFLLFLILLALPTFAWANLNQVEYYYFADNSYSTASQVGYFILYCNNSTSSWGYASEYRWVVKMNCSTGNWHLWCEQYINGSWQIVTCP